MHLRLDWVTARAARFAVENWHYSRTLPVGKNVYIGVWEDSRYIGVIIFGSGACSSLGRPYGLGTFECCELVRVALRCHRSPVSRIVAIAIRLLRRQSPGLRLIVSFADPAQGHVGGIYQAGNWIYCGTTAGDTQYLINGRLVHARKFTSSRWWGKGASLPPDARPVRSPGKHRYLYPLDAAMKAQIEPLRKPYPKARADSIAVDVPGDQPGEDGAAPISALHKSN